MTSWQTRAIAPVLSWMFGRKGRTREDGLATLADPRPEADVPRRLRPRTVLHHVEGRSVMLMLPSPTVALDTGAAVLYLHGGAFVHGINARHWELVADLADATGATVYVPSYGRAPHHTAEEAIPFLRAVVEHIEAWSAAGPPPVPLRLQVAGDSAGGTLALLLAQELRGDPRLRGLTLIAPALDLSLENPAIRTVDPTDPWLSREGLLPLLEAWAGDRALDDPAVSPLFGPLEGLSPADLYVGTRDLCWPDAMVLQELAPADWDLRVHVSPGSPHVHPLLPTPEGRAARGELLARARELLSEDAPA